MRSCNFLFFGVTVQSYINPWTEKYKHSFAFNNMRRAKIVRRAVVEDFEGALVALLCPMRTTLCFRSRSPLRAEAMET